MTRSLRAEALKLLSTRLWWLLLLGVVVFVALQSGLSAALAGQQGTPGLDTGAGVRQVWAAASNGYVFSLVLGIVCMTGEHRARTITSTFLAVPRRSRVVVAKLLVAAAFGLLYAVVSCLTAAAVGGTVLAARGATGQVDVVSVLGGALAVVTLYAVVGVGLGALVRNQVAALVGALVWVLLVEALVVAFAPQVGRWLPGGAANALLQVQPLTGGHLLAPWAGGLLFLGYGLALAAAGAATTLRRDVT